MRMETIYADEQLFKKSKFPKKLQDQMKIKIQSYDFDFKSIQKNDYFIHDFFYIECYLFIVYKKNHFRILLYADIEQKTFVILTVYEKSKNHEKYYTEFRQYARKLVNVNGEFIEYAK